MHIYGVWQLLPIFYTFIIFTLFYHANRFSVEIGPAMVYGLGWYGMVWYGMLWYGMVYRSHLDVWPIRKWGFELPPLHLSVLFCTFLCGHVMHTPLLSVIMGPLGINQKLPPYFLIHLIDRPPFFWRRMCSILNY